MPDRVIQKLQIRNAHKIDFAKALAGMICLTIIAIFLIIFDLDGFMINMIVIYIGLLCGLGWGLFIKRKPDH